MAWKVFFLLFTVQSINAETPCQTPNGSAGLCIPLDKCPSLSSFFDQGSLSLRTKSYMKRSHCGYSNGKPTVCCPATTAAFAPENPLISSHLLPDVTDCGIVSTNKIHGGRKTYLDEFPWMAILQYEIGNNKSFECGGALINKRYVLTAAHCLNPFLARVRLGEYNTQTDPDCIRSDCAPPAIDFGIEDKIIYSTYDEKDPSHYHDIGLIRLDRDVHYNDFIKPVCLPLTTEELYKNYIGENMTVAGWGKTENGTKSNIKLKVPVRDLSECSEKLHRLNPRMSLDAGQICAGGQKGRDSCTGDSGGPLMALTKDKITGSRLTAVGVVSYGPTPCGQEHLPAVYTKVAKYVAWIVNTIKP